MCGMLLFLVEGEEVEVGEEVEGDGEVRLGVEEPEGVGEVLSLTTVEVYEAEEAVDELEKCFSCLCIVGVGKGMGEGGACAVGVGALACWTHG